jgi:hypothetical protein
MGNIFYLDMVGVKQIAKHYSLKKLLSMNALGQYSNIYVFFYLDHFSRFSSLSFLFVNENEWIKNGFSIYL